MRSIGKLFSAFGTLADSVLALAGVMDTATARLRMQLAQEIDPPALDHSEAIDNVLPNGRKRAKAGPQ